VRFFIERCDLCPHHRHPRINVTENHHWGECCDLDGKWMIKTNIHFSAERVAFEHKEFWQVEHAFRDIKSSLDTRPAFSQRDEAIRGHDFYSLLVPVWRKDLCRRLDAAGHAFECSDIEQDLEALQETTIEDNGKRLAIRNQCLATCGKVFQAVRVTIPSTIRKR